MYNYIKFLSFLKASFSVETGDKGNDIAIENLKKEIDDLRNRFQQNRYALKYLDAAGNLQAKLSQTNSPKEYSKLLDEIKALKEKAKTFGENGKEFSAQLQALNSEITNELNKLTPSELKKLKTMSNEELLSYPMETRLKYITKGNNSFAQIIDGTSKKLVFTFTFEGVYNKKMWLETTAGQVLPREVSSVSVGGKVYTRLNDSLNGEFFDENNHRLILNEGTSLDVKTLRTQEEIKQKETQNLEHYKNFKNPLEKVSYEIAYEKGIDPELLFLYSKDFLDSNLVKYQDLTPAEEEKLLKDLKDKTYLKVQLEKNATEIARALNGKKEIDGKYSLDTLTLLFKESHPNSWKEKIRQYGYDVKEIDKYEKESVIFDSSELGSLSASEESGEKGPYAINLTDKNPSYGSYQLCQGLLLKFAKQNGISGTPGTSEFGNNWISKVNSIGKNAFHKMEHSFIKQEIFDVQLEKISKATNYDFSNSSIVMKNVIWSTAVQHGQSTDLILDAIKKTGLSNFSDVSSQETLIREIYAIRKSKFPSMSARYDRELQTSIRNLNRSSNAEINYSSQGVGGHIQSIEKKVEKRINKPDMTFCSQTARLNALKYGLKFPEGDAFPARNKYSNDRISKKFNPPEESNFADIFSNSTAYPKIGHRAFGYKLGGEWFVLDPYLRIKNGKTTREPIALSEYMNFLKITNRGFDSVVFH